MSIEKIKTALETGGNHLGDIVFWSLQDARINREMLKAKWAAAGLDEVFLPEEPTAEKAFRLAAREAGQGQEHILVRKVKDDKASIIFGVVTEKPDIIAKDLNYDLTALIELDRATNAVTLEPDTNDILIGLKKSFVLNRDTHTVDDVRRSITRVIQSFSSVLLRDNGGVWWVPSTYAPKLRQLQGCVESIGTSKLYLLPVYDSEDSNRTLGDAATGAIEGELLALKSEIASFVENPPDRPSTLVRRMEAFSDLKNRAALYKTILSVQVKDLDSEINAMTKTVEELLAANEAVRNADKASAKSAAKSDDPFSLTNIK